MTKTIRSDKLPKADKYQQLVDSGTLLNEDFSFLTGISELDARKALLEIEPANVTDLLYVPEGTTVILGNDENIASRRFIVQTTSVDVFKEWIGRPDAYADAHSWEMPSKSWDGKTFSTVNELSISEINDIEKAGWIYLFNDSKKVSSYRKAIEQYHGTFTAKVYAIKKLVIMPGATLVISGDPSILLIDELVIVNGGALKTLTVCNTAIGTLNKTDDFQTQYFETSFN